MKDLRHTFEAMAECWRRRTNAILGIMDTLERRLGPDATRSDSRLMATRAALEAAADEVLRRATEPELVLAMTGTTSSAKSTLANFLIGEKLLPSAVQEMSAGVVLVRHHAKLRRLRVTGTVGATWETGEWEDPDADNVRRRLAATMETFRAAEDAAKTAGRTIDPVRFEIDWPIRMAMETGTFGLPEGTKLTIMDLPGLNSVSDKHNRAVIKDNISHALCLVAYDCAETDRKKQEELLNQVVDQVRALRTERSSVARMLFVLNKADVFLRDEDPDHSLGAFRAKVTQQLRVKLLEHLGEDRAIIEKIDPVELSPEAAFLAVAARVEPTGTSTGYLEKIEDQYKMLFPRAYWKDLPRNFADASDEQRQRLISDTLRYAKADTFEQRLCQHMADNLPEIIMDDAVRAAEKTEADFHIRLGQFIDMHTDHTGGEAERKLRDLAAIGTGLRSEAGDIERTFAELNRITEDGNAWTYGFGDKSLETMIGIADLMRPIEDISLAVTVKPFSIAQDYCIAVLANENPVPPPAMVRAPSLERLKNTLQRLRASSYREFAESGGRLDNGSDAERVKAALHDLVEDLSDICNFMVNAEIELSGARIERMFQDLTDHLLRRATERGNQALKGPLANFPGLAAIFAGGMILPPFGPLDPQKFQLDIKPSSREEKTLETVIRHERSFWTLYLWRHEIKETRDGTRTMSGIELPGLGTLINPQHHQEALLKPLGGYLRSCIGTVEKHVGRRIDDGISGYDIAIKHNRQEIDMLAKREKGILDEARLAIGSLDAKSVPKHGACKPWLWEPECSLVY